MQDAGVPERNWQSTLASAAGLTPQGVKNWFDNAPTIEIKNKYLAKIARRYRCNLDWLSTGKGEPYGPEGAGIALSTMRFEIQIVGAVSFEKDGTAHRRLSLAKHTVLWATPTDDCYALEVDSDDLAPYPASNQILVVEPSVAPPAGRLVLATHTDGTVRLLTYLYDQGERTYLQHPHRTGPQISYRKSELAKLELVAQVLNR